MLLIHSKKRNRLEHKRMHDLVFVKYNHKLKERYDIRDETDPIYLNDIDDCNEWSVGMLDDRNEVGSDLVHEDDTTFNWKTICEALGVGEPIRTTRQKSRKRKVTIV